MPRWRVIVTPQGYPRRQDAADRHQGTAERSVSTRLRDIPIVPGRPVGFVPVVLFGAGEVARVPRITKVTGRGRGPEVWGGTHNGV